MTDDDLLSVGDAARRFHRSGRTLSRWIAEAARRHDPEVYRLGRAYGAPLSWWERQIALERPPGPRPREHISPDT